MIVSALLTHSFSQNRFPMSAIFNESRHGRKHDHQCQPRR